MRAYTAKVENSGASADGRLSAEEDSTRFYELAQAVVTAGITPDPYGGPDVDKQQLAQALARYASLGTSGTCTGAANTYVVAAVGSAIVPKALFNRMRVVTLPSATNTGNSTANVFGLGSKKVMTWDGVALAGGELEAARHSEWEYSTTADGGTGAWLIVPWGMGNLDIFITVNTTKTVGSGGDFASLDTAFAWLRRRIIVAEAYVTLLLVAGDTALGGNRVYWHAQGSQIIIAGQTVATLPVAGDFTVTGRNVSGDKSANRTMLRTKYPSRLTMGGYAVTFSGIGSIRDLMFEGAGTGAESVAIYAADGGTVLTRIASCNLSSYGLDLSSGIFRFGSAIALSGCAWNLIIRAATALVASNADLLTFSSANAGSHSFSSSAEINNLYAKGCNGNAIQVEGTAHFAVFGAAAIDYVVKAISPTRGASVEVRGALNVTNCTTNGVHAQDGSKVLMNAAINIAVDSGGIGIFAQSGSLVVGYGAPAISGGAYGIRCDDSDVRMTGTGSAAGTTNDLAAFDGGHISASNVSGTTISPARGTLGNSNSYIQ